MLPDTARTIVFPVNINLPRVSYCFRPHLTGGNLINGYIIAFVGFKVKSFKARWPHRGSYIKAEAVNKSHGRKFLRLIGL